jgi:hypothetical protein
MSQEQNLEVTQKLLTGIHEGADPDAIAAMFSKDTEFNFG